MIARAASMPDRQVGIGDQEQDSGAFAQASKNSLSLAISTGLMPGGATATANGNDNTAVSNRQQDFSTSPVHPGGLDRRGRDPKSARVSRPYR